jgi:hypothetical protein
MFENQKTKTNMGNLLRKLITALLFLVVLMGFSISYGQVPNSPVSITDMNYTIENNVQTAPNKFTFDLYVKDTDAADVLELSQIQAGILFASSIVNGGTITVGWSNTEFTANETPANALVTTGAANYCVKLTPKPAPTCGSGQTIPTTGIGIRWVTITVTNTVNFATSSDPNLTFSFATSPYPTKMYYYPPNCTSTSIVCSASNCFRGTTYVSPFLLNASTITVAPPALTGFSYQEGSGPSGEQSFTVAGTGLGANLVLTAPTHYEISQTSGAGYTSPITLVPTSGTVASTTIYVRLKAGLTAGAYNSENITCVSTGATTKNVACSGDVTAPPVITVAPSALSDFYYGATAGPSADKSFTVSGTNLAGDISIAAATDYEISLTSGSGYTTPLTLSPTTGTVPATPVYVRLKAGLSKGAFNGETINLTATGATPKTVTCNGDVYDIVWTGANSVDWGNTLNWSPAVIPTSASDIYIPKNTVNPCAVSAGTDNTCNKILIATDAVLTIDAGMGLTMHGTCTFNGEGGIMIMSSDLGTGSLIDNGFSGSAIAHVARGLTGYLSPTDYIYHFLSSPVRTQDILAGNFIHPATNTDDFFKFDEISNTWINARADGNIWNPGFETSFAIGRGYLVSYPSNGTKTFIGKLNTYPTDTVFTCTYHEYPTGGGGWNLLGNPFPSTLDWDLVKATGLTQMDDALYYYDATQSNYVCYIPLDDIPGTYLGSGTKDIPPMQGFMAHVNHAFTTGQVTINNTMRGHGGLGYYYKATSASLNNYLVLTTNGNDFSDQAFVYFTNKASVNFDGNLDAYKLSSMNTGVPMLYTVTPDQTQLAINSLPATATAAPLPLDFIAGKDGEFSITASQLNTFQPDVTITLEDLKTGTSQNLMKNPTYTFTGQTSDDPARFLLHFAGTIGIQDQKNTDALKIYSNGKTVYISAPAGMKEGQVQITDLLGQTLLTKNLDNKVLNQVQLSVSEGYYIVKVQNDETVKTVKVFIK